jgi:hypothetical protein
MIKWIIKKIKQLFCNCKGFIGMKIDDAYVRVCIDCGKHIKR